MTKTGSRNTVHVVDDDWAVLKSLKALFDSVGLDVKVYETPDEFVESDECLEPGCVIMDLRMPGMSGIELLEKVRTKGMDLPVLFITGYGEVPSAVQAMKAGAVDFLEKPVSHQELLERVHEALARGGERRRERDARREVEGRLALLTAREQEVLQQVAAGRTSRKIAEELQISLKTVEVHRARIMDKMQASNVVDLVRDIVAAGVPLEEPRA